MPGCWCVIVCGGSGCTKRITSTKGKGADVWHAAPVRGRRANKAAENWGMRHKRAAQQQEESFFTFFQTALMVAQKLALIIRRTAQGTAIDIQALAVCACRNVRDLLVGFLCLHLVVCFGSGVAKGDAHAPAKMRLTKDWGGRA